MLPHTGPTYQLYPYRDNSGISLWKMLPKTSDYGGKIGMNLVFVFLKQKVRSFFDEIDENSGNKSNFHQ